MCTCVKPIITPTYNTIIIIKCTSAHTHTQILDLFLSITPAIGTSTCLFVTSIQIQTVFLQQCIHYNYKNASSWSRWQARQQLLTSRNGEKGTRRMYQLHVHVESHNIDPMHPLLILDLVFENWSVFINRIYSVEMKRWTSECKEGKIKHHIWYTLSRNY